MRKALKIIGVIVGAAVVLVLAAALILPHVINPNAYKGEITALVQRETGRQLSIQGDIHLSVFPWLGLRVGRTQLSNAPGFGREPFARLAEADVRVKLLPLLLHKRVEMSTVTLQGLVLNLSKNKAGRTNWADLVHGKAAAPAAPVGAAPVAGAPLFSVLAIGGAHVKDARVVWDNQRSGAHYTVGHLNLDTGQFVPGKPFDARLAFDVQSRSGLNGHFTLSGKLTADPQAQRYQWNQGALSFQLSRAKDAPQTGQAKFNAMLDLARQTLNVSGLNLDAFGMQALGEVTGDQILRAPVFKGRLRSKDFDPRAVFKALGTHAPATADPKALSKASFTLAFSATPKLLRVAPLMLHLDASTARGSVGVRDFSHPALEFGLTIDAIDLDRYLPPKPKRMAGGMSLITPAEAAAAAGGALPLSRLRTLNVNGKVQVGQLQVYRLRLAHVAMNLSARGGMLRASPITADLYQGRYSGTTSLDVRGSVPHLALDESLTGVQVGPLLKDMYGTDRVTGTAQLNAKLTGDGVSVAQLRKSLNGNARFALTHGVVKGVNITALANQAWALYHHQPPAPQTGPNQTDFSRLSGSATVTRGLIRNQDLLLESPSVRATGAGTVNLANDQIDYLLKALLIRPGQNQASAGASQLKGLTVPIRVTGTIEKPRYQLDLEAALTESQKARLQQKKQQLEQKLQQKLQERLKNLFK